MDHLHKVSVGSSPPVVVGDLRELRQLPIRLVMLGLGDVSGLEHAVEDVAVTLQQPLPGGHSAFGVEVGRAVEDRRQHCRLGQGELGGVGVEERLRGSLDPVSSTTEVNSVEVAGENVLFGHLLAHLHREEELLKLAAHGAFLGQVQHLDVLLGDRRAPLHFTTMSNSPRGANHALDRDARIRPEGAVLG